MYLILPEEAVVTESVSLTLSLVSKTVIDIVDDTGPIMLKTALESRIKFVFSINAIIFVDGYWPIPNKAASNPSSCFTTAV